MTSGISEMQVRADGLEFGCLAAGPEDGPLALCLHGFPDTAHTYRHLLPELAAAGFRAVAPFSRGYAPTGVPADGRYQTGALARDANALHEALGGDGRAVVIGHDWGAQATYGAAVGAPERWRKVVAMAVPVGPALAGSFFTYDQIKRSFYMYFFQNPLADVLVAADDQAFVARLWADWSPGYDATEDLAFVRAALGTPENLAAALGYYRALFDPSRQAPELAAQQQAVSGVPPQPTLYLHGAQDGCMGADVTGTVRDVLSPGSEAVVVEDSGHFLHLEQPAAVNAHVLGFLTS
ncbi:Pimeloyl-ACP methyl ester carboxylesterase [Blastococcus aurantiacus]|uniref:Pimeloyl-ACP methyl ester carboxylesterase n=1 Tax=Blastococcus aurantiacus TaxID=1550231 RepID=A0A1G7KUR2_9ACTN|nr:alpha/beta hydrolase [Blastococcus aurantiacus]SDF40826.1 Pimeloyl-ACP methyl ester carboxylesterase [Blastococcus aurantiacus]